MIDDIKTSLEIVIVQKQMLVFPHLCQMIILKRAAIDFSGYIAIIID